MTNHPEPTHEVRYWFDKYYRDEITLEECTTVTSLLIFRDRVSLADEIVRWCAVVAAVALVAWIAVTTHGGMTP